MIESGKPRAFPGGNRQLDCRIKALFPTNELTVTTIIERRRPLYRQLWVHVLVAMAIGALVGYLNPDLGKSMKPLADAFIKLIRMVIAPIVFVTVVGGISRMQSMKEVGRIGIRAIIYF